MRELSFLGRWSVGVLKTFRTGSALLAAGIIITFATLGYNDGESWYWFIATAALPLTSWLVFRRAVPLALARTQARRRWKARASSVERVRYTRFAELRARYADATRNDAQGYVDDRTWADLGMEALADRIDVCFTMAGRNELYRMLRHALPDEAILAERREFMDTLFNNEAERRRLAVAAARIGEESDADPAEILWGEAASPDDLYPLFIGMCIFSIASILVTAFVSAGLGVVGIIVSFISNMWIYYRKARFLSVHIPALRVLSRMTDLSPEFDRGQLASVRSRARGARRAFGWLLTGAPSASPTLSGDFIEMLFLYVKIFFQIDLIAYNRIIRVIRANEEAFRALYTGIGRIDALFALASYRARRRRTCVADPGTAGSPSIVLDRAYHPLLKKPVSNSVTLELPGAIITGTNMAGKSTFLRMLGINALFAQTTGFAFADRYEGPRFRIMSSIEKQDDLAKGRSFYFDEAERIYRMIEQTGTTEPVLLLIDELLSGTNSLERESASIAILHYLGNQNALTVAATHDVAIAAGVGEKYALYYFTDTANEDGLSFDYTLHSGVVKTRNAIKLLRLIGYPEDVISEALEKTGGE